MENKPTCHMTNEQRLIDANALLKFLKEQRDKETGAYSKGRNNGINVAIGAIRNEQICPTVDAVQVSDKELLKAIKLLIKQYEHSKNSDYVHHPVAHAFFKTWRQLDKRR